MHGTAPSSRTTYIKGHLLAIRYPLSASSILAAMKTAGKYWYWIVALLGVAALSGCSGAQSPRQDSRTREAVQRSEPVGDLIVAALRASQVDRDPISALSFAERALGQQPDRPELVWLATRLCADVPRCETEALETRFRKLAPDNGVIWIGPLARAKRRQDDAAERQILEALGDARRFDVYWNTLLAQGATALNEQSRERSAKVLNGPLTEAINEVASWLSAVSIPSFAGLADSCSSKRTIEAPAAERCRRIAQVLQQGDTYAAEAVGIGIAQRVAGPNSPAAIALAERAAVLAYQHQGAREIIGAQVERDKMSAELIELMKNQRREQDVSLAVIRWAGQPLEPR